MADGLDGELEFTGVRLNRLDSHFANIKRNVDFRPRARIAANEQNDGCDHQSPQQELAPVTKLLLKN
jgi:hypothetical protein